jgi:putative ABC transport system ATP-binding protein
MKLELQKIAKSFSDGENQLNVLNGIDLSINNGDIITIKGPSGSGKSTLLNIIGTIDFADSGSIFFDNKKLNNSDNFEKFRNENLGFVFQFHHLIPELSVEENVKLPFLISGENVDEKYIDDLFVFFDLNKKRNSFPNYLSGGEKQRVAIMRSFVKKPSLILADEPTGSLDEKQVINTIELFKKMNSQYQQTLVIATHDNRVFDIGTKKFLLNNGVLSNI